MRKSIFCALVIFFSLVPIANNTSAELADESVWAITEVTNTPRVEYSCCGIVGAFDSDGGYHIASINDGGLFLDGWSITDIEDVEYYATVQMIITPQDEILITWGGAKDQQDNLYLTQGTLGGPGSLAPQHFTTTKLSGHGWDHSSVYANG